MKEHAQELQEKIVRHIRLLQQQRCDTHSMQSYHQTCATGDQTKTIEELLAVKQQLLQCALWHTHQKGLFERFMNVHEPVSSEHRELLQQFFFDCIACAPQLRDEICKEISELSEERERIYFVEQQKRAREITECERQIEQMEKLLNWLYEL